MRQLCHVAGLVELGWVDFVDSILLDFLLRAIVTLYQQIAARQLFHHPSSDKGGLGVTQPDVALAREVVLALDDSPGLGDVGRVL